MEDARVTALITSEPAGAEIYIDGRKQPETTNAKIPLPRGTYQVKVVKPGVGEAEQVLVVDKDRRATFVQVGYAGPSDPMFAQLRAALEATRS